MFLYLGKRYDLKYLTLQCRHHSTTKTMSPDAYWMLGVCVVNYNIGLHDDLHATVG